jgi:uncharacterized membrane protein YphA (DoxX/SURF4 family)
MNEQQSAGGLASWSPLHWSVLVLLRVAVGWHLLYEGYVKLVDPTWSSAAFLAESRGFFSGLFHWMAADPGLVRVIDFMNIWGLVLIGLGLLVGFMTRAAAISGVVLLSLYYLVYPPFVGVPSGGLALEGSYLYVNKNLVEMCALLLLAFFPSGHFFGLDRLRTPKPKAAAIPESEPSPWIAQPLRLGGKLERRDLLHAATAVPLMGAFVLAVLRKRGWESHEEKHLRALEGQMDAVSNPTVKVFHFSSIKELKGELPFGQIGNLKLSRLFLGGNLIGGWAHARDLIYVSKLVRAYHTDQKVFDTFRLAERCGINAILTNPQLSRVINLYWRREGGKILFISDCGYKGDAIEGAKLSIDGGAHACYVQGEIADRLARQGRIEEIGKAVEFIRQNGLPAGVGAHCLNTVKACVAHGIKPDYWVKTIHHVDYWSARPDEEYADNVWCTNPEETTAFMANLEEPWIGFKILAAGAIPPREGFRYALQSGADFLCVGMYDFQIVDDVNIALEELNGDLVRTRPWRA